MKGEGTIWATYNMLTQIFSAVMYGW